jgi:hypothetical protein
MVDWASGGPFGHQNARKYMKKPKRIRITVAQDVVNALHTLQGYGLTQEHVLEKAFTLALNDFRVRPATWGQIGEE